MDKIEDSVESEGTPSEENPEEKKPPGPKWVHEQKISFEHVNGYLEVVKDRLKNVVEAEKDHIKRLSDLRKSFKQ